VDVVEMAAAGMSLCVSIAAEASSQSVTHGSIFDILKYRVTYYAGAGTVKVGVIPNATGEKSTAPV